MKLTKRGEYGLKALIDLAALDDPQAATQIKDIARRQDIPEKFLRTNGSSSACFYGSVFWPATSTPCWLWCFQ